MESRTPKNRSEEEFFFREDQEKLRQWRQRLDLERKEREERHQRELHWMKCPKCGHDMREIKLHGVLVDKCLGCHGVFFDQGEWSLLMESEKEEKPSFLTTLHSLLAGDRLVKNQ